jgi:hypothetical protein
VVSVCIDYERLVRVSSRGDEGSGPLSLATANGVRSRRVNVQVNWPKRMRDCNESTPAVYMAVGAFLATASVVTEAGSWKMFTMVIGGAAVLCYGLLLQHVCNGERQKKFDEVTASRDGYKSEAHRLRESLQEQQHRVISYRKSLLSYELHNLIQLVGIAIATEVRADRRNQARVARQSLVHAAAKLVGESDEDGTRANLFRFDRAQRQISLRQTPDPVCVMRPESGASAGRGVPSTRTFPHDHPTTRRTLACHTRFVLVDADGRASKEQNEVVLGRVGQESPIVDTSLEQLHDDERVGYAAFITYPVVISPGIVYGALTVDSVTPGALQNEIDLPIMSVLADLIAITYECEIYPNVRTADQKCLIMEADQE